MNTHIAVILTDPNKRILWVNDDFTAITGYTLSDAIGKVPGAILQGPETEPDVVMRIRRALQLQVPLKEEITNYRKNGEAYICKLVIHPVFDRDHQLVNYIAFEINGSEQGTEGDPSILEINEKYRSSSLKGIEELKLFERLKYLFAVERYFLDPQITLKAVADKLVTNTKYLSQVVNHQAGMNFQQFVNVYRVEEAKTKMLNATYSNLTLYGVGLHCGFKNKSTFYKVFKEVTGFTPKEFIRQNSTR